MSEENVVVKQKRGRKPKNALQKINEDGEIINIDNNVKQSAKTEDKKKSKEKKKF